MRSEAEVSRRGLPLLAVLALLALGVGNCGGTAAAAGELVSVLNAEARLDGQVAAAGDPIEAGSRLDTNQTGVAQFRLVEPALSCRVFPNASVEVRGSGAAQLRYVRGAAICTAEAGEDDPLVVAARDRTLAVTRAVFRVDVDGADALIQVQEGAVQVAMGDGAKEPGAGPGDPGPADEPSTPVPAGSQFFASRPDVREPLDLDRMPDEQREALEEFAALQAQEEKPAPPPGEETVEPTETGTEEETGAGTEEETGAGTEEETGAGEGTPADAAEPHRENEETSGTAQDTGVSSDGSPSAADPLPD